MGLFDKFLGDLTDKAEERKKQQSALERGRLRETNTVKGASSLPSSPGIYQHINKETGAVEYVGQTDNIRKRQQEHVRAGKLDLDTQKVRYGTSRAGADKDALLNTEKDHIARHKPIGNKTKGGNGRR